MKDIIPIHWKKQFNEIKSGTIDLIPEDDLISKLKWSYKNQNPLKIKFGVDPSQPDIHIGHTVILNKLKKFQDFGHEVYFLIGDFTALIGDPTGKKKTRPTLTKKEVRENAKRYKEQVSKILDENKLKIVYNSKWFEKLSAFDLVNIISKTTVHQISSREDFSKRIQDKDPIHLHEFIYPVLQGYDSVQLSADLEIGGTDQLFNLLMGRNLQGAFDQKKKQVILTLPLLEGTDGVNKMSKSLNNTISIEDKPSEIFGKVMSLSDELMIRYYSLVSRKDQNQIQSIIKDIKNGKLHPMEAKKRLALELTSHYYPLNIAQKERDKFEKKFSKKEIPTDLEIKKIKAGDISLPKFFQNLGWVQSKGEFRRLLTQEAIRINHVKYNEEKLKIEKNKEYLIKVGKLRWIKIIGT